MKTYKKQTLAAGVMLGLSVTGATIASNPTTAHAATTTVASATTNTAATAYYKMPYNATVMAVTGSGSATRAVGITWSQYVAAGFPAFRIAPTQYVKYPWSDSLYAVNKWSPDAHTWTWKKLDFSEWRNAGYPRPATAGWIPGSIIYKYPTSDQLLLKGADGSVHSLSFQEWANTGFAGYATQSNQGYQKLSWNDNVAYMSDVANAKGSVISGAQWAAAGFPRPQSVKRFAGDQFYSNFGSPVVYYQGPTLSRAITYSEWLAAGAPTPAVRGVPAATAAQPVTTPPTTATQSAQQVIDRTLVLVNAERQKAGLRPYRQNAGIAVIAQQWSDRMASNPTAPTSTRFYHRPNSDLAALLPGNWITGGENIAFNSQPSAEVLNTQFMNSPGHRANILSANFTDIGIGYTVDANGYGWITQNFAQY